MDGITPHSPDRTGLIPIAGEEAQRFLQVQLNCDVAALASAGITSAWTMKREKMTLAYTTRWNGLPMVRA